MLHAAAFSAFQGGRQAHSKVPISLYPGSIGAAEGVRQRPVKRRVLHSPTMLANRFFFATFWFSPLTGGWRSNRA
jgi:hypothetical protein